MHIDKREVATGGRNGSHSGALPPLLSCCRRLESQFGAEIFQHVKLSNAILDEEQKQHILEEGKQLPGHEYLLGEALGIVLCLPALLTHRLCRPTLFATKPDDVEQGTEW